MQKIKWQLKEYIYYIDASEIFRFPSKRKIGISLCEIKMFISLRDVIVPISLQWNTSLSLLQ